MLPLQHRMRTGVQFSQTIRSGVRSGRRNIVLSAAKQNAVVRNRVKRRLREAASDTVKTHPHGYYIAVRALPASKNATYQQLHHDYTQALTAALMKLAGEHKPRGAGQNHE